MTNQNEQQIIEKQLFQTYIAVFSNAENTKMFKNGFVLINGNLTDVMRSGELSCAFFVSSVLKIFDVIGSMHATVKSTVTDLNKSGWIEVNSIKTGDVIVWQPTKIGDDETHVHIGFAIDTHQAISNDFKTGTPKKHMISGGNHNSSRKIASIYRGRHLFEPSD